MNSFSKWDRVYYTRLLRIISMAFWSISMKLTTSISFWYLETSVFCHKCRSSNWFWFDRNQAQVILISFDGSQFHSILLKFCRNFPWMEHIWHTIMMTQLRIKIWLWQTVWTIMTGSNLYVDKFFEVLKRWFDWLFLLKSPLLLIL